MLPAAWVCLLLPLAAAAAITLAGTRISRRGAGWLATAATFGSFVCAVVTFFDLYSEKPADRSHTSTLWMWLTSGDLHFGMRILVDPLSVFMMLIVAGVGSLIVAYSIGYMDGDDEERRYFAYMALFVFSMLLLVQSGNLLLLLVGWGLVGLSSYLLIGFWHQRPSAIAAAKKAFIMNAVGDATFVLALFLLIQQTGSLDFETVFNGISILSSNSWVVNLIALGLLGGAIAKSAQLPLHTWLPDAMEGPTPVSALIHAATMVTAGVYLIVRTHAIFEVAPKVQDVAAGLGAATLVLAGLIALVQTDIKRVIAYSTMSQIGYMFLGAGLGAYGDGMFHLMTHAFFKALLFMAAGMVIHVLLGEQDIRAMGGLRRFMPLTWIAFWIGGLALVGIPPFAGFFSKDAILAATLHKGIYGAVLWVFGMLGAFLTGAYTFRMIFVVFGGEPSPLVVRSFSGAQSGHADAHAHARAHGRLEGPPTMALPVAILAVLSIVGGWLQFANVWTGVSTWLDPVAKPLTEATSLQEALTSVFAVLLGAAGIGIAWWYYAARKEPTPKAYRVLERKFYFDELYNVLFHWPAVGLARGLDLLVERPLVDGTTMGVGELVRDLGTRARTVQTGLVRTYAFAIAASLAVLVVVFISVR